LGEGELVRRLLALLIALVAGALIAWAGLRTPSPAPADAPARDFSATRALGDVRLIAPVPHPIGSTANHAVRDRLRARMAQLGLSPRLRRDDVLVRRTDGALEGASPETLIGVLSGRDPRLPALALMAHYDSVPGAPGAADDGAGVSAVLEIVRALRVRGVPPRDVIVILTDGEEADLFGARSVFANDPVAHRIGFLLNLEARGSGGRALMFETGKQDAGAVALFRRTAVRPVAGSLFGAVYDQLPNDTDFTIARNFGVAGLNYAFTGRTFDYHSPTDSIANLELGALQDLGDQGLAAAAAAAFAPALPPRGADVTYGVLFGRAMISYPPPWGWLVLALAAALTALGFVRARRFEPIAWRDVARGAAAALYAAAAGFAVLHLAGAVAGGGMLGDRRVLAAAGRWEAAQILLGLGVLLVAAAEVARGRRRPAVILPLAVALASCVLARGVDVLALGSGLVAAAIALAAFGQPAGRAGAWLGVLLLVLAAATVAQVAAPLTAYVLAWPLTMGALSAAATALSADRRPGCHTALTLIAAIGLGWVGVFAHLVVIVVGLPELMVLPLVMAAPVVWPLAQPAPGAPPARLAGRVALIAGALLVVIVRLVSPWNDRHPQSGFVAWQLEQNTGHAWRLASPDRRTAWSDAVLAAGGRTARLRLWPWSRPVDAAPTRPVPVPAPQIALARRGGRLELNFVPPPGARTLRLDLAPDAPMRLVGAGAGAADQSLPGGRWTDLRWTAPDPAGLTLTMEAPEHGRLALRYAAVFDAWPGGVAPPPSPPSGVAATAGSGQALITGERSLTW
jgi:hypothetical protein